MKNVQDVSLAEFSATVDEHLGYEAGFADAVAGIHEARVLAAWAGDRRTAYYRKLEEFYLRCAAQDVDAPVVATPEGQKVLRQVTTKQYVEQTVPSAKARKADPAAWERARVPVRRCSVAAPEDFAVDRARVSLPVLPAAWMDTGALITGYKSPKFAVIARLRDTENELRLRLEKIAADSGWDGGENTGPLVFADGWQVRLRERRYSSEAFKKANPQAWRRLAVSIERGGITRLDIIGLDQAIGLGYVDYDDIELDEIDGD